jgi:outer membrane lipoprotein-sorting protein
MNMKLIHRPSITKFVPMLLIGFVIFAGTQAVPAQGIINEILARMDAHNKALTSLRANVTMVKVNAQLGGAADTTEGTVAYLPIRGKNPAVRVDWISPKETLAVIDKKYIIYRPALSQAYTGTTDRAKGNPQAGNALAFMNMSKAQLKANYSVIYLGEETVKGGTKTWHLQMTPKTRASYKTADVWVDGNGMPVQSKVTEENDDSTTVLLTNLQKNVRINTAEFTIKPPNGTKIIKS